MDHNCTEKSDFLDKYNSGRNYKAMVSGIHYSGSKRFAHCYFSINDPTIDVAVKNALFLCATKKQRADCRVFARGGNPEAWVLHDRTNRKNQRRRRNSSSADLFASALTGVALGAAAYSSLNGTSGASTFNPSLYNTLNNSYNNSSINESFGSTGTNGGYNSNNSCASETQKRIADK